MNLNQAVITTKYIIDGNPILEVIRDEEGDWQFLGGQEITEEDAVVLSLQEIIDIDNTLMEVLTINKSYSADRYDRKSKWCIQKI